MTEFNLSDKRLEVFEQEIYLEEDVKEFIKKIEVIVGANQFKEIQKLAGDKLI